MGEASLGTFVAPCRLMSILSRIALACLLAVAVFGAVPAYADACEGSCGHVASRPRVAEPNPVLVQRDVTADAAVARTRTSRTDQPRVRPGVHAELRTTRHLSPLRI